MLVSAIAQPDQDTFLARKASVNTMLVVKAAAAAAAAEVLVLLAVEIDLSVEEERDLSEWHSAVRCCN